MACIRKTSYMAWYFVTFLEEMELSDILNVYPIVGQSTWWIRKTTYCGTLSQRRTNGSGTQQRDKVTATKQDVLTSTIYNRRN